VHLMVRTRCYLWEGIGCFPAATAIYGGGDRQEPEADADGIPHSDDEVVPPLGRSFLRFWAACPSRRGSGGGWGVGGNLGNVRKTNEDTQEGTMSTQRQPGKFEKSGQRCKRRNASHKERKGPDYRYLYLYSSLRGPSMSTPIMCLHEWAKAEQCRELIFWDRRSGWMGS
jgi:hypothetical protein